ncbi:MAG: glycosyltransferase, partial [Motiliproteus sp.]
MSNRVLHIITGLATGGAETMLYKLLAAGLHESDDVIVVSLWDKGVLGPDIEQLGIRVECLGMRRGVPSLAGIKRLRALVREFGPQLIQGWMYHGDLAATIARRWALPGTRLIWNVRNTLYALKSEKILTRQVIRANRLLSSRVDGILYNSELSRQQHQAFGFCANQSRVIGNGFDLAKFGPNKKAAAVLRASLGIPMDAVVVGHVARFHPMKDHQGFLQAMKPLLSATPSLYLLMSGRGVENSNPELTASLRGLPMDRVCLLGEQRDTSPVFAAMDLFCLSSKWGEGFPNVLGEAMASGVPCVARDVGDSATVLGNTGTIVPSGGLLQLTQAIENMVNVSTDERRVMATAGRERIADNYSIEAITDQYRQFYQKVME